MHKDNHTEIVLSGVEGDRFFDTAYHFAECRRMLMSFLYMGAKGTKWFENRVKKHPDVRWLLDSGAHTFRTDAAEFSKTNPGGDPKAGVDPRYHPKFPNLQWFEDYVRRYGDWLNQNKHLVNVCVNLDVDNIVGIDKVLEWDYDVFRPLERQGVPVCYVWHENFGFDFWLKMCREHEYVGLPGHLSEVEYNKMLRPAILNGCRVHGFALTKAFVIGRLPFATIDSISWKSGEMYGQTFNFEGSKLRVYDKNQKDQRKRFKAKYVAAGIDWDLLEDDKAEQITQVNALAWRDYINYAHTRSQRLAYWQKTSKVFEELGDLSQLSAAEVKAFFEKRKFPYECSSEEAARRDIQEIKALCVRDPEVVFDLSDDRIEYWLSLYELAPENDSRPEREATVRQFLYQHFYDVQAEDARGRESLEDIDPRHQYRERDELPPVAAAITVELDLAAGHRYAEGSFFVCYGDETNVASTPRIGYTSSSVDQSTGDEGAFQEKDCRTQVQPDTGFVDEIEDRILRVQATLGVELLFDQFKLNYEAQWLKIRRKSLKRQRELRAKARGYAERITEISDQLGSAMAERMMQAATEAYDQWVSFQDPTKREEALKAQERALRPQNRLTPEQAREMGRRGGAPVGNQNARKHGLYSQRMPNLACDNCPHIQVCPQYRAGHVCAFLNEFNKAIELSEGENPEMAAVSLIMVEQIKRARRALLQEVFEGGVINKETSKVLRDAMSAAQLLHQMKNPVTPFGGRQDMAPPPSSPRGQGILEKIFGGKPVRDAESIPIPDDA